MNQPDLYRRANQLQRFDAEEIIKEFSTKLMWRRDNRDRLLDIGCGSGDVLMDFIYPIMPKNFEKLVGTDVSPNMINHARSCYQDYKNCEFEVLDIGSERDLPSHLVKQFDHVTSFYCLHWVQNLRQAVRNIFKLLRSDGGDCLLVFVASVPLFDIYIDLSKSPKWSIFMEDVHKFVSPLQFEKDPQKVMENILFESGFSDIQVEVRNKLYNHKGIEMFKERLKAVCPFLKRIPPEQHSEFMNDLINGFNMYMRQDLNELDVEVRVPYKLVVAYAKEPLSK